MASHEIAALQCPSCGSSNTGPTKPLAFGAEFTCAKCGSTSVLIINRALLPVDSLQKSGDQVCAECGRVADRKARFCQDGHKLVRSCISCQKEFAAHHQRCDYCGWPQDVRLGTQSGYELELDRAIAGLSDAASPGNSKREAEVHLRKIVEIYQASGQGKRAVASIVELLKVGNVASSYEFLALGVLGIMGADASGAMPFILQLTQKYPNNWTYWQILAMLAPEEVLPYCRNVIASSKKNPEHFISFDSNCDLKRALNVLNYVGKPAIPMLREFCGLFSGKRGDECNELIERITSHGKLKLLSVSSGGWTSGSSDE